MDVGQQGEIRFAPTLGLEFPDDDFREQYRGEATSKGIPHGQGTLVLKDGQTVEAEWEDGVSATHEPQLAEKQQKWQKQKDEAAANS